MGDSTNITTELDQALQERMRTASCGLATTPI